MVLPRLHTLGRLIKNEHGQTVHLTGVHWADLVDKPFFYCGPGVINWRTNLSIRTGVAKEMGANHIRYSIALEKFINPYTGSDTYKDYATWMDNAVNELVNHGIYGYFVLHYGSSAHDNFMEALLDNDPWTFTVTGGTYNSPAVRDDWMLWCEQLASHYANIPNVFGFQIWAEPGWGEYNGDRTAANYKILFKEWWQFNLETAQAIHRGNPDAIVVVMSPGYYWTTYMSPNQWDGRNGEGYGLLPESNIIYGVQKYESEDYRGGAMQQAYSDAYEDWYNGVGTLGDARALHEAWYQAYCFDFAENFQVPVINTEMAYCDDLLWNYKDDVDWAWQPEQAQGFYFIWKKYSQNWTQHRWQIGAEYGGGSAWGFFASMDTPNVGDYALAPSGELMKQNFSSLPMAPSPPVPPIPPPPADYYRVYATADEGGQVSPSGIHDVLLEQSFTITATADTDWLFDHWVCNGVYSYQDYTFTIPSGPPGAIYYVTAYFQSNAPVEPDPPTPPATNYFSVNIGTSTGGTTNLIGKQTLEEGQTLTVNATPNNNYRFAYWLLDGVNWGTNKTFTLAGAADTSYTLLPVFQYIPPPPPNKPFSPSSVNVGKLSSGRLLTKLMKAQAKVKPIDFDAIFKKLKRTSL